MPSLPLSIPAARPMVTDGPDTQVSRASLAAGMVIIFALTFLLRLLTARFGNDHFTHLSRARQILLGEWPIRDFFDPGQFLHYYLSAAAQLVFGYNLYGEALLTASFMALGAALTFGVSSRLAGSRTIGACAALLSVAAFPRLYNYPKVFLYVAAIWLAWWYAHGPNRRRLLALAAFSALAFLFRYDHGAYIGGFVLVLLTLLHAGQARQWRTAMAAYAALCCVLLLPFAMYVQWAAGLPEYVQSSVTSASIVGNVTRRALGVGVTIARAAPAAESDEGGEGSARFASAFLTRENALAWFTGVTLLMPFLAGLWAAWAWARGTIPRAEAATALATACLCLVITRTLLDNNPDARLADVAPPTAALGAWVAGRWLAVRSSRGLGALGRVVRHLTLAVIFAATAWSVSTQARFLNRLRDADVHEGPLAAWTHLKATYRRLHLRPIDDWAPPIEDHGIEALAKYAMRCTAESDRLLIAGEFAPEVYFYAERAFAGGQVHFMGRWHDSLPDQQLTIERLRHQSVPVVFMGEQEAAFRRRFGAVADYIASSYVEVPFEFNDDKVWRVLVERQRMPVGIDAQLGLPCYRASRED